MSAVRRRGTRRKTWSDPLSGTVDILQQVHCPLIRVGKSILKFEGPGSVLGCVDELVLEVRIVGSLILRVLYHILVRIHRKQAPLLCPAGLLLL